MTLFGLGENEITPLLTALAGRDVDRDAQARMFARAAWTGVAEPGDRMAGLTLAVLGAPEALRLLLDEPTPERLLRRLHEAGAEEVTPDEATKAVERWTPRVKASAAVLALRQAARVDARLLIPGDELWPAGVDDLGSHAPIALWMRGTDAAVAALPRSIALVGARAATGYGEHITMEASAGLVDRGFAIVSGAAYGIDGMAHRAALASRGTTIAFLAGGLDRFYPSGHDALLTRIAESGAVLSEVPCGTPPTKWRFLQRNRLIAAASQATVVLEAGYRSGSLNTASHALTIGRPVGVVPGPVTSAASAGCHKLIRGGLVTLVTSPDEMAQLIDPVETVGGFSEHSTDEARLLDSLSTRTARTPSDLAARSGLSVAVVQALLGALELEGRVVERERGWARVPPPRPQRAARA